MGVATEITEDTEVITAKAQSNRLPHHCGTMRSDSDHAAAGWKPAAVRARSKTQHPGTAGAYTVYPAAGAISVLGRHSFLASNRHRSVKTSPDLVSLRVAEVFNGGFHRALDGLPICGQRPGADIIGMIGEREGGDNASLVLQILRRIRDGRSAKSVIHIVDLGGFMDTCCEGLGSCQVRG